MNNNIGCCCCRDNQNFRFGQLSKTFESGDVIKNNKKGPGSLMDVLARHESFSLDSPAVIFFHSTVAGLKPIFKKAQRGSEAERQKGREPHSHTHASHDLDLKAKPDRDNTRAPKRKKQSGIKAKKF